VNGLATDADHRPPRIVKVGVLLGNGNGTFQAAVPYGSGAWEPRSVVVADVNGDGKLDLLVANQCISGPNCTSVIGGVTVLLGNGNGTFQPAVAYGSGGVRSFSVAVADVNGDGKPDLLVTNVYASNTNWNNGTVGVLLGNGDGTFQSALAYPSGGYWPWSVAVADLNKDGKRDVVVANQCSDSSCGTTGSVGVLLGNGDGTLQTAVPYDSRGSWAWFVTLSDVNGDAKPDVIVANYNSSTVGVLSGRGDGTFQTAATFASGGDFAYSVAVADVNGDGKPDLVVANLFADSSSTNGAVNVLINTTPSPYKALVQPPINADNTSIFKSNRGVIPVKFTLTQNSAPTCQLPAATISVTRTAGGVLGSVDESTYSMAADNGSNFRIDSSACQYVYNLAASALGVGAYEIDIRINGTVVGKAVFALK
jgi:hypothetical protein